MNFTNKSYGTNNQNIEEQNESILNLPNENEQIDDTNHGEFEFDEDYDDFEENGSLLTSKVNKNKSSKFLGLRKSVLHKLPFRFPRSKRKESSDQQSQIPNHSNRSHSVNTQYEEKKHEQNRFISFLYSLCASICLKIVPSSFILSTSNANETNKESKFSKAIQLIKTYTKYLPYVKTAILVIYLLLCVSILVLYDDREENWNQSVVSVNKSYQFNLKNLEYFRKNPHAKKYYYSCDLFGPFLTKENEAGSSWINNINYVKIDISNPNKNSTSGTLLTTWSVNLLDDKNDAFSQLSRITHEFEIETENKENGVIFEMSTTSKIQIGINFNCRMLSTQASNKIGYTIALLIFVYGLIMFDIIHRTLAAALGAVGGIAIITLVEMERPSFTEVVQWVEWETILLMFGMMIIVAIFCETGLFDLIAVQILRYFGDRIWIMIFCMTLLTAILSAFLDNVTTILLMSPITIKLSEVLSLDPRHLLIAQVIFSNIGGTSTAIGDPPNLIITANKIISSNGIDFATFTLHMFVGSIFVYAVAFVHFRMLYLNSDLTSHDEHSEVKELKKEIFIWGRTFKSITPLTKEEKIVKTLLKEKVSQLQNILTGRIYHLRQERANTLVTRTNDLVQNYKINNVPLLIKCSFVFGGALILFFLHPFLSNVHFTVGWISILSAVILLALTSGHTSNSQAHNTNTNSDSTSSVSSYIDLESVIHKVEWSTLIFFACLFIFMKSVEELGLLSIISEAISEFIESVHNKNDQLVIALTIIVIVSALISSIIDNIPFTTTMIPIIIELNQNLDLPLTPLVYALAFGSCLGGNGTLIGASCNLVAVGIAEQYNYKITFTQFFKVGFPIMISSVTAALVYICVSSIYLEWY